MHSEATAESSWIQRDILWHELQFSLRVSSSILLLNWAWMGFLGVYFTNIEWWRHQMEIFSALLVLCAEIQRLLVNSPHKGQWRGALVFSLISAWKNVWVNDRDAVYLRRYRAHYEVAIMFYLRLRHGLVITFLFNCESNYYSWNNINDDLFNLPLELEMDE